MSTSPTASPERYWIALNGSSCALTQGPMAEPKVTPTPEQMLGFLTLEEARRAQHISLHSPMDEVRRFQGSLRPDVGSGRIRVIQPSRPQPHTRGPTMWTDSAEVHAAMQQLTD